VWHLWHGQTLYQMWAKSGNPRRSYCSSNIWPYDLEHVSRVALCSCIVYTTFKLSQAIRSWNVTFFDTNTSYHAMTLTLDSLTLNFCGRSGIMCSIHVPNLSEIGQSAAEILIINKRFFVRFRGAPAPTWVFWKNHRPICTKFGGDIVRSSLHRKFNKNLSYRKETVRLRHNIEIGVLHRAVRVYPYPYLRVRVRVAISRVRVGYGYRRTGRVKIPVYL